MSTTLSSLLRQALEREKLRVPLSEVASDTQTELSQLSRFTQGERGLSTACLERLCTRLGIRISGASSPKEYAPLRVVLRSEVDASGRSLRAIANQIGIDPGNFHRFVRGERSGLRMKCIDRLCACLRIEIEWSGTLIVEVLRERQKGHTDPIPHALVQCICPISNSAPLIDMSQHTDIDGVVEFAELPIGSLVDVTINGTSVRLELLETSQRYAHVV